ncbi:MAG: ankyrin repeat domain-containing protein [Gammaproteobacteria bacterium]|nr:ankyrin repeat domain-containing protein [Gammaproteobacteria bacterium]
MQTLADAIIEKNIVQVREALRYGSEVNVIDEYGFTPLIEAVIANDLEITQLILNQGAAVNLTDMLGTSALHWAVENNNTDIAKLLLDKKADPNAFNLSGQPLLTMPVLREHDKIKKLLISRGADLEFAKDFINTKMLGHLFELVGVGSIISPDNQFVEVDFEGFLPEVTLAMIAESLQQFRNHFAARRLRQYATLSNRLIDTMYRAAQLIRYQQYSFDRSTVQDTIEQSIAEDPLIIPVSYEGHAVTFIRYREWLVKCDRRVESRLYDNVVVYRIGQFARFNSSFIQQLMYAQQSFYSVNEQLPVYLDLQPITEMKVPAQISGNCSWANAEACIPAVFFLLLWDGDGANHTALKSQALQYFEEWREWNKDRALQFCVQRFESGSLLRRACTAEILAAILFQCCTGGTHRENERAGRIIETLKYSECDYVLKNYARSYAFEDTGFEGQRFMRLLQQYGFDPRTR